MIFRLSRCCYICGHRVHHGAIGALLTVIGAVLMLDDVTDFPWRLRD